MATVDLENWGEVAETLCPGREQRVPTGSMDLEQQNVNPMTVYPRPCPLLGRPHPDYGCSSLKGENCRAEERREGKGWKRKAEKAGEERAAGRQAGLVLPAIPPAHLEMLKSWGSHQIAQAMGWSGHKTSLPAPLGQSLDKGKGVSTVWSAHYRQT